MQAIAGDSVTKRTGLTRAGERSVRGQFLGPSPEAIRNADGTVAAEELAGPQAFLVGRPDQGATIKPHFHPVSQFQLVVSGTGRLGKHPLTAGSLHYSDANTPYGPIVAGPGGLEFLTLRERSTSLTIQMPGGRDKSERARRSISAQVERRTDAEESDGAVRIEPIIARHGDGLAAWSLQLEAGARWDGPPSNEASGQYVVVLAGAVHYGDQRFASTSCFFLRQGEALGPLTAGQSGVTLVVLNFPRSDAANAA